MIGPMVRQYFWNIPAIITFRQYSGIYIVGIILVPIPYLLDPESCGDQRGSCSTGRAPAGGLPEFRQNFIAGKREPII